MSPNKGQTDLARQGSQPLYELRQPKQAVVNVVNVVNVARGAEPRACVTDRGCEAVGSQQLEHLPVGGRAETG